MFMSRERIGGEFLLSGRLDGKFAWISGGCSGMGLGTAELFVEQGARVVVADVQADKGRALEESSSGRIKFALCDVAHEEQIGRSIDAAVDAFGGLDIVFNNAGIPGDKSAITDLTVEGWDRTQAVNLRSQMLAIKHAVPHLKARGGGSIINSASGAAILPYGGGCAYGTSKAGVVQMSRLLAEELGPDRIRVNAILPGFTPTSATGISAGGSRAVADRMVGHYDEAGFAALQPFPLAGEPRYIAEAVLFLASDASVWITGVALPVDGGLLVANQRSPALGEIVGNAMELARQDVPD